MTTITPLPTQLSGAAFLAANRYALLADSPRVGKTGAAIIGCDYVMAVSVLVITTASGRGVWKAGFAQWSAFERDVQVAMPSKAVTGDVVIVGWPTISSPKLLAQLLARKWDLIISDEDHFAKNFEAKRTQALYGTLKDGGISLETMRALFAKADRVWPLTGTPLPHSPADMYPRLRALAPERLRSNEAKGWPCVMAQEDYLNRYTVRRPKKISRWNTIMVVMDGKNLDELRERCEGFILRRTQQDVGIRPPVYDMLPLTVSEQSRKVANGDVNQKAVLEAAERGDTRGLEMHLGPLRRVTGMLKARAVVDAVKDEFECGLDKIVLAYWHKDVGEILADGLSQFGVVGIDGSTPTNTRQANVEAFSKPDGPRVFLGQIEAAGEAIDLSASAELWFVESSFSPKAMQQMSLRITNHTQARQAIVKVCSIPGSIDEALQARLMTLWAAIRKVLV